jgi:hypothetical protein
MKTTIYLCIGSCLLSAAISGILVRQYYTKPIPNNGTVITSPVVSPVINTPPDLACDLARSELFHYNNDMPVINYVILEQTRSNIDVMVDGALYKRKFLQDINIPLMQTESGNWKFGLGVTVGAIAVVGISYGAVKLYDKFH